MNFMRDCYLFYCCASYSYRDIDSQLDNMRRHGKICPEVYPDILPDQSVHFTCDCRTGIFPTSPPAKLPEWMTRREISHQTVSLLIREINCAVIESWRGRPHAGDQTISRQRSSDAAATYVSQVDAEWRRRGIIITYKAGPQTSIHRISKKRVDAHMVNEIFLAPVPWSSDPDDTANTTDTSAVVVSVLPPES